MVAKYYGAPLYGIVDIIGGYRTILFLNQGDIAWNISKP